MEDAALVFRVHAAEEKVDVLEKKIEEMEKSFGHLQAELHHRRRGRRHSPIVTIGSGSLEDPLEIVSEADRQRACRTQRAVEVLDKAVQVPDVEEEEGEGSDSSGLSYCTVCYRACSFYATFAQLFYFAKSNSHFIRFIPISLHMFIPISICFPLTHL